MTAKDRAIIARWTVRLRIRVRLLARARAEHKRNPNSPAAVAKVKLRKRQVAEAERVIQRHRIGTSLRVKAWQEMGKLIEEKVSEVGGNNRGQRVEQIIRANGGVPGEPWCGDTIAFCYLRAGATSVVRSWAAVRLIEKLLTRVRSPRVGHVVTYTFDHTGLFRNWAPEHGAGYFYAGEGNTGDSGASSDSVTGGDGVKLKLRHTSQVSGFWRVLR